MRRKKSDPHPLQSCYRPEVAPVLEVGDTVAYAKYFLLATGHPPTDEAWAERGIVLSVCGNTVEVDWGSHTSRILAVNLAKPGPNLAFCG